MALGATFWAAAGDGVRWMHDWTGYYEWSAASGADPYILTFMHNIKMFQLPFSMTGAQGDKQTAPQHDSGYFFWGTAANAPITICSCHASIAQGGNTGATAKPAWKEICYTSSAKMLNGDIPPSVPIVYDSIDYFSGIVQTGFISKVARPTGTAKRDAIFWIMKPSAGDRSLYHYNPWAWFGTVPAVIADIVMKCGVGADYIDHDAFDNAHDAYDLTTGDAPWTTASGLVTKWEIGCSRRIGEKCIDLVMNCARHSRDLYFVNEAGKLSVNSFTRWASGTNYATSLGILDGVTNIDAWSWESRYLYNWALCSWGSGVVVSGDGGTIDPNSAVYMASEDDTIAAYLGDRLSDYLTSPFYVAPYNEAMFGRLWLRGQKTIQNNTGQSRLAEKAHFPFSFSPHNTTGHYVPIYHWFVSDSFPRRFVTLTQDMRGLDWGIGAHVANVAVTDDGQTISEAWCIERTYDFDRLTVTSVLMEQPPNT